MKSFGWSQIMVVQPWFSALGHPAQSTLNLSRVIPREQVSEFLISAPPPGSELAVMADSIGRNVPLRMFPAAGPRLRFNTLRAALRLIARRGSRGEGRPALLFLDADLLSICALMCAGLFRRYPLVCVVHLAGPERMLGSATKRALLRRAARDGALRLFVRSPELLEAWRRDFPQLAPASRLLPPLEAALQSWPPAAPRQSAAPLAIGVVGQIRVGKCLPELLQIADRNPEAVSIAVHGPLYTEQSAAFVSQMRTHPRVRAGFMSEAEMLRVAASQDYLAGFLQEDQWDMRMESATFWLGVKAGRPVLCFGAGWIGRMVRESGCGIILPGGALDERLLAGVPRRDSPEYARCLESIERLRLRLTPAALWAQLESSLQ